MSKTKQIDIWNTFPVLDKLFAECTSGKLRYAISQNLKRATPHRESALSWLESDRMDFAEDWVDTAPGHIPFKNEAFLTRFNEYLLTETVEFEPYYFPESLLQFADGIDGKQEVALHWLLEENKPKSEAPKEATEET